LTRTAFQITPLWSPARATPNGLEWCIRDPWHGRGTVNGWQAPAVLNPMFEACAPDAAAVEAGVVPAEDEPSIFLDSDNDGIVHSEEDEPRFDQAVGHDLQPNNADSDNDGIPDKDEVHQAYH
jgi:hypothetical protein